MRLLLVLLAAGMLATCAATPVTPDQLPPGAVRIAGTVSRMEIEGGFWTIRGDDGVVYDPVRGLTPEFQVNGLRVSAVIRVRTDMAGTHMVGPLIEVITIARLP
jgi:hypothetical protein